MHALKKKNTEHKLRLRQILEHARAKASVLNNAVEKPLQISDTTTSRYLKMFVDRGIHIHIDKG